LVSNEELAELTNSKQNQKRQSHRRLLLIVVIVVVVVVGVGVVGCLGMLLGWFVGLRSCWVFVMSVRCSICTPSCFVLVLGVVMGLVRLRSVSAC